MDKNVPVPTTTADSVSMEAAATGTGAIVHNPDRGTGPSAAPGRLPEETVPSSHGGTTVRLSAPRPAQSSSRFPSALTSIDWRQLVPLGTSARPDQGMPRPTVRLPFTGTTSSAVPRPARPPCPLRTGDWRRLAPLRIFSHEVELKGPHERPKAPTSTSPFKGSPPRPLKSPIRRSRASPSLPSASLGREPSPVLDPRPSTSRGLEPCASSAVSGIGQSSDLDDEPVFYVEDSEEELDDDVSEATFTPSIVIKKRPMKIFRTPKQVKKNQKAKRKQAESDQSPEEKRQKLDEGVQTGTKGRIIIPISSSSSSIESYLSGVTPASGETITSGSEGSGSTLHPLTDPPILDDSEDDAHEPIEEHVVVISSGDDTSNDAPPLDEDDESEGQSKTDEMLKDD